jgi:hypothetical protein
VGADSAGVRSNDAKMNAMKDPGRTLDELLDQAEVKDWLFRAEREMFPKMETSRLCLLIVNGKPDARLALEIGAAILLDKPIIVLVLEGKAISDKLRAIASEIVTIENMTDSGAQSKIRAALGRVLKT